MSGHVDAEILDILEGRLSEQRMEEVRRHLGECEDCAADVALARALREHVQAQGSRHLSPERVLDLAEGDRATGKEREHLDQCLTCRGELEWARSQAPAEAHLAGGETPRSVPSGERATPRPPRWRPAWRWALAGAGVALAAVVIVMLVPIGDVPPRIRPPAVSPPGVVPPTSLASLARVEALPVRFTRAAVEAGSFEEARLHGLEAYETAAYDSAISSFRVALGRKPGDAEMMLYTGSAELLGGNAAAAIPMLEAAARAADPTIRTEALRQLVDAQLLTERGDDALATAQALSVLGHPSRIEADSLIARIQRARSTR